MKAEEWLTYFVKIYGRRPKMTEVDEAIQNGSLLANRAEVERLLLASKKSIWQTLSQSIVAHKVAASVLAVSCMTLLGGGAIFAWHSHHSQGQQTSSLAVASSSSQSGQTSSSDKSKQTSSSDALELDCLDLSSSSSNRVPKRLTRLQVLVLKVRVLHRRLKRLLWMWKPFEMVIFQASKVTGFLTVVML